MSDGIIQHKAVIKMRIKHYYYDDDYDYYFCLVPPVISGAERESQFRLS